MSEQEIIARLYRQIKDLEEQRDAVIFTFNQADKECAELRALLTRAANALEGQSLSILEKKLVTELRKAAE